MSAIILVSQGHSIVSAREKGQAATIKKKMACLDVFKPVTVVLGGI